MQNNNWSKIVGIIVLVIVVTLITSNLSNSPKGSVESSVYDKVIRSGVIKSCYVVYSPALIKDPNTGKLSGIFFETLNKEAENMSLKVDWNVEVGWGDAIEALNSGKCDIVGSDMWNNSIRGKSAEFVQPLYYSAVNAYVRADDNRFSNDINVVNNENYKLVTMDGEISQLIASQNFPKAKTLQLSQLTDLSQVFINVVDGKADMAFQDVGVAYQYSKNNPGKIKVISKPIVVYGNSMMVKKGEFALKTAMDNATLELLNNGFIDSVINKYAKEFPGGYYRVAAPYEPLK